MSTRYFALIFGIIYTIVGILGFIPGAMTMAHGGHQMTVNSGYGNLLGLFPVNILHTLVHLGLGIWGLFAYRQYTASRNYARTLTVIFAVLTIMGLIPGLNTVFGLIPLYGNDIWLHAVTAIVAAYFGWKVTERHPTHA